MSLNMDQAQQLQAMREHIGQLEATLLARMDVIERRLGELAGEQSSAVLEMRRTVVMRTARGGEVSSRIAQRLAKCEAAIDLLACTADSETADHI